MTSRTGRSDLRVLVVGGGVGGLCLAHGLRSAGIDVNVYERDSSAAGRHQGYRLRISAEGEQALRECLPKPLVRLLVATSNHRPDNELFAYDENLVEQWAPTFDDPRGDTDDKVEAVDRVTLRRILLTGLRHIVHFDKQFTHYEQLDDGRVAAHFADGTSAVGDVLVAADGVNSRVRAQLRPSDSPRDLGVRTIFSRISRAAAVEADLTDALRDRFSYVIGSDGNHVGLMPMIFRNPPLEAAGNELPSARLVDAEDYYMAVLNVHREDLGLDDEVFFSMTGAELCKLATDRTSAWHPELRGLFDLAEPDATFAVGLHATYPVRPWQAGPIIGLGDAVHVMPPSGGVGANTALRDASALSRTLKSVATDHIGLIDGLHKYYAALMEYANINVLMSLRIAQWSIKKVDGFDG